MELFLQAKLDLPYSDSVRGLMDPYKNLVIDSENDYLNYLWCYCVSIAEQEGGVSGESKKLRPNPSAASPPERRTYSVNRPVTVQSVTQPQLRPQPQLAPVRNSKGDKKQRHGVCRAVLAAAVCVAIYLCSIAARDALHRSSPVPSMPSPSATSTPTPTPTVALQPRPESGHVFYVNPTWSDEDRIAPFSIETKGTDDFYIKLVDVGELTGETRAIEFYIRGGDTVHIDVPIGIYELRYAAGSSWRGEDHLFGDGTSYHKAADFFTCYEDDDGFINGWTVELYLQENGNLETREIGPSEF